MPFLYLSENMKNFNITNSKQLFFLPISVITSIPREIINTKVIFDLSISCFLTVVLFSFIPSLQIQYIFFWGELQYSSTFLLVN